MYENDVIRKIAVGIYQKDYPAVRARFETLLDEYKESLTSSEVIDKELEEMKKDGADKWQLENRSKYWHDYNSGLMSHYTIGLLMGFIESRLEISQITISDEYTVDLISIGSLAELEQTIKRLENHS